MKTAGAILIVFAGVAAGFIRMQLLGQKIDRVRVFRDFLLFLRTQISFSSLSLEELICACKGNAFASLMQAELPNAGVPGVFRATAAKFFLTEKDRQTALAFLAEFGRADLQNQMTSLDRYILLLNGQIAEGGASYREKFKVNVMLYSFIGVAVALVLI